MSLIPLRRWLAVLVLCMGANAAQAAYTISYEYIALAADTYRASFRVTGVFGQDEGFSILFPAASTVSLEALPLAPNGDWFVSTTPVDPGLPADGTYDARAIQSGASTLDPFVVDFTWSAQAGSPPGSLPFQITNADFSVKETGMTTPIPEPSSLLLLTGGIALLMLHCRRKS